jgi:ubiquinone/menaquinone biosynthesis C-methylase UbiE
LVDATCPSQLREQLVERHLQASISNRVINLCADKQAVFTDIHRVLKPGGWLQFADIANGRPGPPEALRDIDLWTG